MTNHLLNNALLGKTWLTCYFLDFKHHWFWGVSCEEKKGGNRDSSWLADRGWYYPPANVYKKYGKSPCLLGKSTINGNFQYCSFLYVYQRVPSILGMRGSQHNGAIFSWVNQHLHHGWCVLIRTTRKQLYFSLSGWWFGTWILFFHNIWECHHPNWRTHIFQRGRYTTNQFSFWITEIHPDQFRDTLNGTTDQAGGKAPQNGNDNWVNRVEKGSVLIVWF